MTTTAAVAATQPLAMTSLAEHMVIHHLPAAADITIPGRIIGESTTPDVHIILDVRSVTRWVDSLDQTVATSTNAHTGGTWYDTWGVANNVRVRLSWYIVRPQQAPFDMDEPVDEPVALPGITRWVR